jgi:ABC-type transport system involved in multi-copper enzyme maturation permease subunit
MRFLPIVGRELRVAARRRSTYALRLFAALTASTITLWLCSLPAQGQPPAVLGKSLFAALTTMAFAYCLLIGPFLTADCVSSEKRDGTLGLLFLTDLRSYDVVLGKWVATSLAGFYGLLAVLPSLGVPLLLGGVTPGEYGRTALAVVNAILFSLTTGMLVSAVSRDQTKAILGSLILVLALSGLLPGVMALASKGFWARGAGGYPPLALASPIYSGQLALDGIFRANPKLFWLSTGIIHSMSWLLMIATMLIVPHIWRQEPADEPAKARRWWLRLGWTRGWKRKWRKRLESNPVYAVAARHRWPHWVFWMLVGIVAINIYWFIFGHRQNPAATPFHLRFSQALVFMNRVWIAAMACRFFAEARRTGALELILTTPVHVGTILAGRRRALLRLFFWPVVAIAVLHYCLVWGMWNQYANQPDSEYIFRTYAKMATKSLAGFLTDIFALTAVGAWFSLSSKRAWLVVLNTFILVTLIPWVLLHLAEYTAFVQRTFPKYSEFALPAALVTKNLLFLGWATYKVRRHFRAAAAETYGLRSRIKAAVPGAKT